MKKLLLDFLIENGGKKNSNMSWSEILQHLDIEVDDVTKKWASDTWRYYKKKNKNFKNKQPKILILDIENTPMISYTWGIYDQRVNPTNGQLIEPQHLICWSAKWLFDDKVLNSCTTPKEILNKDDYRVTKEIWYLLEEADIVIGHNMKGFDIKHLNSRFLVHGFSPPSTYQVIDTLLHARKRFKLASNKLDYLGKLLLNKRKIDTGGFKLWVDCMKGDKNALKEMQFYCDEDVRLTEDVYLTMRAWVKPSPNFNIFMGTKTNCPTCGSNSLNQISDYKTYANTYNSYRCNNCSAISRANKKVTKLTSTPK